jgi:hypothetical protein
MAAKAANRRPSKTSLVHHKIGPILVCHVAHHAQMRWFRGRHELTSVISLDSVEKWGINTRQATDYSERALLT